MSNLNHFDECGNAVMVDVSAKEVTSRRAIAQGRIKMQPATLALIAQGRAKKGDVLGVARVAGIMAAKQTAGLIPLCHPLMLDKCSVDFVLHDETSEVEALCTVQVSGKTGVEMEALTGAGVALLTIYDMCKAADRGMEICALRLLQKEGGKSGLYTRDLEGEGT